MFYKTSGVVYITLCRKLVQRNGSLAAAVVLLQSPGHVQGEVVFNHHLCFVGGSEFSTSAAASLHVGEGVDRYRVQWVWHNNRLQCDPQKRASFQFFPASCAAFAVA